MVDVQALAQQIIELTPEQRGLLKEALNAADRKSREEQIVSRVAEVLKASGISDAEWVLFHADEWDNGWYLSAYAVVYSSDGYGRSMDVPGNVEDLITDQFGRVCRGAAFAVNPTTGETCYDDSVDMLLDTIGLDRAKYTQV